MVRKRPRVVTCKPSKTGCRTCRFRRIKCDETRPQCDKCTSTGRTCDGYEFGTTPPADKAKLIQRPIVPAIPLSSWRYFDFSPSPGAIGINYSATNYERQAFDYFLRETAGPLWIISPSKQWIQAALQMAMREPTVFHAIAAVGSVHSIQHEIMHHTLVKAPLSADREALALKQYVKATAALQSYIDTSVHQGVGVEPILLCCILFVVYEVLQDNGPLARAHLHHGLRAVRNANVSKNKVSFDDSGEVLFDANELVSKLLSTFHQLGDDIPNQESQNTLTFTPNTLKGLNVDEMPTRFSSVQHAKQVLEGIVSATLQFRDKLLEHAKERVTEMGVSSYGQAIDYCILHCLSRSSENRSRHSRQQANLSQAHEAWIAALPGIGDEMQARRSLLMQIQHFYSFFTLATSLSTAELEINNFTPIFRHILDIAELYLRLATSSNDRDPESEPQKSFSLDHAVLPTLYIIILKCRASSLRRRAMQLLKNADRREGTQWSENLVYFAESMVQLETRLARQALDAAPNSNEDIEIPETARVLDMVIAGISYHEIRVICGRFKHEYNGELEIAVYRGHGFPPLVLELLQSIEPPFAA